MKHALIITTIAGFLPQFEMNDVKILKEQGYTIHYASDFENPVYNINQKELEQEGLVLHHIDIKKSPFRFQNNIKAVFQLKKIMVQEKIQLVHCHNPMGGVVGRVAALFSHRNPYMIYTAHGFHFYKGAPKKNWILYYTAERLLAACTDRLITINHEDHERAKGFRLRRAGKAERIPGVGVDISRFCKKSGIRQQKRRELGIPEDAFHIVSVGELNENKNHEVLIRAIAAIKRDDFYYSICGEGCNREKLQSLITGLGLGGKVQLLGYRTDVDEVLQAAECFAFPSKREGLGIAAVEAMACEVPVIASDNRGTREYMRHGENGLVCPHGSMEEYKEALLKLAASLEIRKCMGANGRRVAEAFSLEATDKIMRRVYQEVRMEQERMMTYEGTK